METLAIFLVLAILFLITCIAFLGLKLYDSLGEVKELSVETITLNNRSKELEAELKEVSEQHLELQNKFIEAQVEALEKISGEALKNRVEKEATQQLHLKNYRDIEKEYSNTLETSMSKLSKALEIETPPHRDDFELTSEDLEALSELFEEGSNSCQEN